MQLKWHTNIGIKGISPILPVKELVVSAGVVTREGEPVRCYWCRWQPGTDDITSVDGLLLGGFTPVRDLAKLKGSRLAVHSCYRKRAMPLVRLMIEPMNCKGPRRSAASSGAKPRSSRWRWVKDATQ
jgi:hypothetical protein